MKALSNSANFLFPEIALINETLSEIVTKNKTIEIGNYYKINQGKKIRPALFLLCTSLFSKEKEPFIPVACALELIHNATLIHDDIVDSSEMRRGSKTINSLYGNQVAVLFGDFLFTEAFKLLVDFGNLEVIKTLSEVVSDMTSGEIKQLQELYDCSNTEEMYLQRVTQKTALFFAACCFLAGVVSDADERNKQALWSFGLYLGVAFQIKDDLLDLQSDEQQTGKEMGNDLKNGVITLPLIFALRDINFKKRYLPVLEKQVLTPEDISSIIDEIKKVGGISYSMEVARKYMQQALQELNLLPCGKEKDLLEETANYIMHRES